MDDTSSVEPRVAVPQAADTAAVPWWRTPAVLISALAFVLSLGTALVSIYTAHIKDVHDRQKELSDIVEKLLQLPLTEASIYSKGLNDKAISLQGVFNDQENMLTNQAYNLTRKLGANAPTVELLVVGRYLVNAENYAAVKKTYRSATEVADNFLRRGIFSSGAWRCSYPIWTERPRAGGRGGSIRGCNEYWGEISGFSKKY